MTDDLLCKNDNLSFYTFGIIYCFHTNVCIHYVCAVGESLPSFIPFIYPSKYRKCHLGHCYSFLSEANSARQSLFEKLTQLEITVSTRDAQRLTIQAQAEEMVSLTKEVALLKEDCFALTRRVHITHMYVRMYL